MYTIVLTINSSNKFEILKTLYLVLIWNILLNIVPRPLMKNTQNHKLQKRNLQELRKKKKKKKNKMLSRCFIRIWILIIFWKLFCWNSKFLNICIPSFKDFENYSVEIQNFWSIILFRPELHFEIIQIIILYFN